MCAVDGLKWWPVGGYTVGKPRRRFRIIGRIMGVEKLRPLLVEGRAVAHR